MKKFICYISALLVLCSCSNMNLTVQHIMSAADCIESNRWSWNNGIAISDNYVDMGNRTYSIFDAVFSFKSKLSGTLKFSYILENKSEADIEVKIDGKSAFHATYKASDSYPIDVVLKNIPKNKVIEFKGVYCTVSNVMITSIDDSNHNTDFDF